MFAARSEMVSSYMVDSKYDFILCDRYFHASIAYQGYGRKLSLNFINHLIDGIDCPIPDLTIIYDLDVNVGFKRKKDDLIDRIESAGIEFFEDVRKGYQQLTIERKEVELIDASQEIELIETQTKNLVARLL